MSFPFIRFHRGSVVLIGILIGSLAMGCRSQQDPLQERFSVSGTITLDGHPVPTGAIMFLPDRTKGNDGQQGVASIVDGTYDTGREDSHGAPSGPTLVTIRMIVGEFFYFYETRDDFPKQASTKDYHINSQETKKVAAKAFDTQN